MTRQSKNPSKAKTNATTTISKQKLRIKKRLKTTTTKPQQQSNKIDIPLVLQSYHHRRRNLQQHEPSTIHQKQQLTAPTSYTMTVDRTTMVGISGTSSDNQVKHNASIVKHNNNNNNVERRKKQQQRELAYQNLQERDFFSLNRQQHVSSMKQRKHHHRRNDQKKTLEIQFQSPTFVVPTKTIHHHIFDATQTLSNIDLYHTNSINTTLDKTTNQMSIQSKVCHNEQLIKTNNNSNTDCSNAGNNKSYNRFQCLMDNEDISPSTAPTNIFKFQPPSFHIASNNKSTSNNSNGSDGEDYIALTQQFTRSNIHSNSINNHSKVQKHLEHDNNNDIDPDL